MEISEFESWCSSLDGIEDGYCSDDYDEGEREALRRLEHLAGAQDISVQDPTRKRVPMAWRGEFLFAAERASTPKTPIEGISESDEVLAMEQVTGLSPLRASDRSEKTPPSDRPRPMFVSRTPTSGKKNSSPQAVTRETSQNIPVIVVTDWDSSRKVEAKKPGRDRWGSRLSFWLAAVGGAVGIGNLWRFPGLCFKYGGGAFFLPYLIALFFLGIPLLTLELGLGQKFQAGHLTAFNRVCKRASGVGLAAIFVGFMVTCYYTVILAWSLRYCIASFRSPYPWAHTETAMDMCASFQSEADCLSDVSLFCRWSEMKCYPDVAMKADDFFNNTVLQNDPTFGFPSMNGWVVLGLGIVWIAVFLALFKGVLSTGKAVYITMTVPVVLLIVIVVRGCMLEGAMGGIKQYLGVWDFSMLITQSDVWAQAIGQIYFSIGVGYGVMSAYASYNDESQNVAVDTLVIAFSNTAVSILAGLAVFAVGGHLALTSGYIDINGDPDLSKISMSGIQLVFVMYPTALSSIPYSNWLSVIFFVTFFLLGVDSAFALAEALVTMLADSKICRSLMKPRRWLISLIVCVIGFCIGLPYCTSVGLNLLDAVDNYLAVIASLVLGLSEAVAVGWVYGWRRQKARVGARPLYLHMAAYFLGGTLTVALCLCLPKGKYYYGIIFGLLSVGLLEVAAFYTTPDTDLLTGVHLSARDRMYFLTLFNIELFRDELNGNTKRKPEMIMEQRDEESIEASPTIATLEEVQAAVGTAGKSKKVKSAVWRFWTETSIIFSLTTKYVIPLIMITMLLYNFFSGNLYDTSKYPGRFHSYGLILAALAVLIILLGCAIPQVLQPLVDVNSKEKDKKKETAYVRNFVKRIPM